MPSPSLHPCQTCGACCAHFRVRFYWREAEVPSSANWAVPTELTEDLDANYRVMCGTRQGPRVRCVALRGEIGREVDCSIYTNRPGTCRDFPASFEDGTPNPRCDRARAAHGLPALTVFDWPLRPDPKNEKGPGASPDPLYFRAEVASAEPLY